MKISKIVILLAVLVFAVIVICLFRRPGAGTRVETTTNNVPQTQSGIQPATTIPATNQPHNVADVSQGSGTSADIIGKYQQGLISKDEALTEIQKRQFIQSQSLYGKIIDQNGDPVSGVDVTAGNESLNATRNGIQGQTYTTQSDSSGLFEFTGKTGTPIGIKLHKDGYKWGERGEGYKAPVGGTSSPFDRVVLTMWKLRGAETLTGSTIDAKIPHDGETSAFDIISTGRASQNGDMLVSVIRSPLEVRRGKDIFDWTLKIQIPHGGLLEESDPYPFWAPQDGYQPSFQFSMSSNNVHGVQP